MASFSLADLCKPIDVDIDCSDLAVLLPGGIEVGGPPSNGIPVAFDCGRALIGILNSALAPLGPIFSVLEAIICVFEVVKSIPDALGPPPDPTKIARKIQECTDKFDKLLNLLPPVSIPRMVKQILSVLLAVLRALKAELEALIKQLTAIDVAAADVHRIRLFAPAAAEELLVALGCARDATAAGFVALEQNAKPLNRLLGILNFFLQLAGMEPIPSRLSLGVSPDGALEPLDALIEILTIVRAAIP